MTDRCPYTALGGCCGSPATCDELDCPTRQRWAEERHDMDLARINHEPLEQRDSVEDLPGRPLRWPADGAIERDGVRLRVLRDFSGLWRWIVTPAAGQPERGLELTAAEAQAAAERCYLRRWGTE